MAAASCFDPHRPHAAAFPAMAHHGPCGGGSAYTYYGATAFSPAGFGAAPDQAAAPLDVFEYLLSDEGVPADAVPARGTLAFGTPPPPRMSSGVPDGAGYTHARSTAAAVATDAAATRTTDKIAFRTRSEEEVLDDGYKWRKYGKKSVKNSPSPRNYYRCSMEGCAVKKRVERDREDPGYVVTMYEGVHNHVCPGTVYYAAQDAVSGRFFVAGMHRPDRP